MDIVATMMRSTHTHQMALEAHLQMESTQKASQARLERDRLMEGVDMVMVIMDHMRMDTMAPEVLEIMDTEDVEVGEAAVEEEDGAVRDSEDGEDLVDEEVGARDGEVDMDEVDLEGSI